MVAKPFRRGECLLRFLFREAQGRRASGSGRCLEQRAHLEPEGGLAEQQSRRGHLPVPPAEQRAGSVPLRPDAMDRRSPPMSVRFLLLHFSSCAGCRDCGKADHGAVPGVLSWKAVCPSVKGPQRYWGGFIRGRRGREHGGVRQEGTKKRGTEGIWPHQPWPGPHAV